MKKDNVLILFAVLMALILLSSTFIFLQGENTEFVYYNVLFFILLVVFVSLRRHLHLGPAVIISLSLVAVMHILGGLVYLDGVRLYDISLGFLQYDNLLHSAMGVAFAFLLPTIFQGLHSLERQPSQFILFVVLATLGCGALVEIAEYSAVEFLGAPGVGDYFNNARDLVFDLIGAFIGAVIMLLKKHEN